MMNEREFSALATALDRSNYWPVDPERGALNFLTAANTLAALTSALTGEVISCADRRAAYKVAAAQPLVTSVDRSDDWLAVNEKISYDQHGPSSQTHIDALGHFFYQGRGYGGTTTETVRSDGVTANDVLASSSGIIGRGLLLDLPLVIDEPFVPSERLVRLDEITRWLDKSSTSPASGDVLFVRTGRPLSPEPPPGSFFAVGGLDLDCAQWIHDSEFSLIVSDAGMDAASPVVESVLTPWHVLTLSRMGLCLVDCADLEDLAAACRRQLRTTFLAVIAAMPIPRATASPVNPLAVL